MGKKRVFSQPAFMVLWLIISGGHVFVGTLGASVGINYGQIANDLPSPTRVSGLIRSLNISKVKLYDADPYVLRAFANSDVEFTIGIGNELVLNLTDRLRAEDWVRQHVQPYLPQTRITCITVGNEVFSSDDSALKQYLLTTMNLIYVALFNVDLHNQVKVSTAHSLNILSDSYPPSLGSFRTDLIQFLQPLLEFHSKSKSPFLINIYPFFAYRDNPDSIPLDYALFRSNSGIADPNTNLNYDNMLYAQVDAVYSAIMALGHPDIQVRISETGWPSRGDPDEIGATPENAATYNGNLLRRMAMNQGTPLRPSVPVDVHVFALFNEDLKPGPTSERNYGLYYPNGTPVYNIGLDGQLPSMMSSSTKLMVLLPEAALFIILTAVMF